MINDWIDPAVVNDASGGPVSRPAALGHDTNPKRRKETPPAALRTDRCFPAPVYSRQSLIINRKS